MKIAEHSNHHDFQVVLESKEVKRPASRAGKLPWFPTGFKNCCCVSMEDSHPGIHSGTLVQNLLGLNGFGTPNQKNLLELDEEATDKVVFEVLP